MLEVDKQLVKDGREQVNGVPLMEFWQARRRHPLRAAHPLQLAPERGPARLPPGSRRFRGIVGSAGPDYRIGEDERDGLVVNRFRNEPGAKYKRLGWHTDSLRDLFSREAAPLPQRRLLLHRLSAQVGGLRVLPCTHNQSIASLLTQKVHFVDDKPDENELAITAKGPVISPSTTAASGTAPPSPPCRATRASAASPTCR